MYVHTIYIKDDRPLQFRVRRPCTLLVQYTRTHYADTFEIKLFPERSLGNSNGPGKGIFRYFIL